MRKIGAALVGYAAAFVGATLAACGGGESTPPPSAPTRTTPSSPAPPAPTPVATIDAGAPASTVAAPPAFDWPHAAHALDDGLGAPVSAQLFGVGDHVAMVRFLTQVQSETQREEGYDGLVDLATGCVTETQRPKDRNGADADVGYAIDTLGEKADIVGAFTSSRFHTMITERLSWLVQLKVTRVLDSMYRGSSERSVGISDDQQALAISFNHLLYVSSDGGRTFRQPELGLHVSSFGQGDMLSVLYFVPGTHRLAYTVTPSPGPQFSGLHAYTLDLDAPDAKPRLEVTAQDYANRVYMTGTTGIFGNRADRCFYGFTLGAGEDSRAKGWCVPGKSPGSFPYFHPNMSPSGQYGVNLDEDKGKVTALYFRTDGSDGGAHPLPGKVDPKLLGVGPDDRGHFAWSRGPLGVRVEGPDGVFDLKTSDVPIGFGTNGNLLLFHVPKATEKLSDVKCTLVRSVDPKSEGTAARR